ncbi:MAG: ATP-binding protein [Christensenellaceae bacterium]
MKKRIVSLIVCMLIVAMTVTIFVSAGSFKNTYTRDVVEVLKGNINAMELVIDENTDFSAMAIEYEKAFGQNSRITVLAPNGDVLVDTSAKNGLENHADRPEILMAKDGGFGQAVRYSKSMKTDAIYVAKELPNGMMLRTSMPLNNAQRVINQAMPVVIITFILLLVLAILFSNKLVKNVLQPLRQFYKSIQSYIDGKQETIAIESKYREIDDMANAFSSITQRLNRYIERVKQENKKTAVIIDSINEGLLIIDQNSEVLLINTAAKNIFGAADNHANILHYIRRQEVLSKIESALKKKKNKSFDIKDEISGKTYRYYTSIITEGAFLNRKSDYGMLVLISDVTELEQAEQIRKDFAANVSHELKTPLTSINGFAQLVANDMVQDKKDVIAYAKRISEESDRLMGLINDTLKLSELEQISIDEAVEEVDIKSTAQEVLHLLEDKIKTHGLSASITGAATVKANKNRIKELLLNLCDNAIKYNVRGGMVEVQLSQDEGYAVIKVKDSGIGIPKDEQNRIFERFYRAKNAGGATTSGTGLGLAIVKHIATLYDGEISLASVQEKGSEFTVKLKKQ